MRSVLLLVFLSVISFNASVRAGFEAGEAANQKGDRVTAFNEYYKAAYNQDIRAYGKLASMYLYGLGTAKDYVSAYAWFAMAHATGDKYSGQFKKAASSRLTREQLDEAEKLYKSLLEKFPPPEKAQTK